MRHVIRPLAVASLLLAAALGTTGPAAAQPPATPQAAAQPSPSPQAGVPPPATPHPVATSWTRSRAPRTSSGRGRSSSAAV
jgi:hypothetical protein